MLHLPHRLPAWLLAVLLLCLAAAGQAQQVFSTQPAEGAGAGTDPPDRVAAVTDRAGSVVFAPAGDEEWVDLPANRPLTVGDRLWSDAGARAELHLGTATLHLDQHGHLGISALDGQAAQFILLQGALNARVRELAGGENFEIGTPHLALRALEPGDYRVDVDAQGGLTRVTVRSGRALVFGETGQSVSLSAGQSRGFTGRALAAAPVAPAPQDALAQWAAERNRAEDHSVAARHVPRGVVGYPQLDAHGSWGHAPEYGAVWYPRLTVQDWAPYRHGHWSWIDPWGWTWVDDAPWGFAPFHYGRWAQVGARWAWIPGDIAARPAYAPALVAFFGDAQRGIGVQLASGPAVGWYPLAPGEAWWPGFRASTRYVQHVNRQIDLHRHPRGGWQHHVHRHRHFTAVQMDDFRRGRPVRDAWRGVHPVGIDQARGGVLVQPPGRHERFDAQRTQVLTTGPRPGGWTAPARSWNPGARGDERRWSHPEPAGAGRRWRDGPAGGDDAAGWNDHIRRKDDGPRWREQAGRGDEGRRQQEQHRAAGRDRQERDDARRIQRGQQLHEQSPRNQRRQVEPQRPQREAQPPRGGPRQPPFGIGTDWQHNP